MNEAASKVIEERQALDRGFPAGVVLSAAAHLAVAGIGIGSAWFSARPRFEVIPQGFAVSVPRGGGGPRVDAPAPPAAAPAPAEPAPAPPKVEAPPQILKPPKEEPRKGLPPPDAKRPKGRPQPAPPPRAVPSTAPDARGSGASGGVRGATAAASSATPGLGIIGPAGPGAPNGTDPFGDWYLAAVQRKIWLLWTLQVKSGFAQNITVSFTILGDGRIEDGSVRLAQSSGVALLDLAAQRAVLSAQPFGPLPRNYATNRITIQALFQPTP